jgi:dynein heavy chain
VPEDKRKTKLPIQVDIVNPKAISEEELYGANNDSNPPEWQDGIFSTVLKRIVDITDLQSWIILDGPVDTLWVESLNSVMDDSKLLTLTNGDRIGLSDNMNLLFEVENLAVASPATVSRAGMIYMDIEELGWEPYMRAWIRSKGGSEEFQEHLKYLAFDKYLPRVLKQKRTMCEELAPSSESGCIISMCKLYDSLSAKITRGEEESQDDYFNYIEKWFVFSMIWSVGATVDEVSRKQIDYILRELEAALFPASATVYEYFIKLEKRDFVNWDDELKGTMLQ